MNEENNGVKPIDELNKAIQILKDQILEDSTLTQRLEIGIVCFDDDARVERSLDLVSPESSFPILQAGGRTNVVAGMEMAMKIIEERKTFYKSSNEQYYRPYIVLFTYGAPTNSQDELQTLDDKIQLLSEQKRFVFMPIGVGISADLSLLVKLAAECKDPRLKGKAVAYKMADLTKFADVFAFIFSGWICAGIGTGVYATVDPNILTAVTFPI